MLSHVGTLFVFDADIISFFLFCIYLFTLCHQNRFVGFCKKESILSQQGPLIFTILQDVSTCLLEFLLIFVLFLGFVVVGGDVGVVVVVVVVVTAVVAVVLSSACAH